MKLIMNPTPAKPAPATECPTNMVRTPRTQAITIIKRTLEAGDLVDFDQTTLRFLKRGQCFEEGDQPYQALETGCFIKLHVWEHAQSLDDPPSSYQWGYYCACLDDAIEYYFDRLSPMQQEQLVVHCVFSNVMRQQSDSATARRTQLTTLCEEDSLS